MNGAACWRIVLAVVAGLTASLTLSGPGRAAEDGNLIIYPYVWEAYEDEYLALKNPSAFAVSRDGSVYGYSYCPERRCVFNMGKKTALESCEEGGGKDCVIFAVQRDIVVDYKVLDLTASGSCPKDPAAKVTIVADMPEPTYDYSMDTRELTRFEMRGRARTDWSNYALLGLFTHDVELLIESDVRPHITESDGLVCAGFEDSEIHVGLAFNIYIISDLPKGSCMYKEVLEHEERHHAVARELYAAFSADATRRLAEDIGNRPYVQVSDPVEGRAAILARAQEAIDAAFVELYERYEKLQGEIDTDEEYERVANACPDAGDYLD